MQIDVSGIKNLPLKLGTFKKMPRLRFLKFYLPLHVELTVAPNDLNFQSPGKLDVLLSSAWCKELLRVASEIHIKCHHYLLVYSCSNPSLMSNVSTTNNEINMQIIT